MDFVATGSWVVGPRRKYCQTTRSQPLFPYLGVRVFQFAFPSVDSCPGSCLGGCVLISVTCSSSVQKRAPASFKTSMNNIDRNLNVLAVFTLQFADRVLIFGAGDDWLYSRYLLLIQGTCPRQSNPIQPNLIHPGNMPSPVQSNIIVVQPDQPHSCPI